MLWSVTSAGMEFTAVVCVCEIVAGTSVNITGSSKNVLECVEDFGGGWQVGNKLAKLRG